MRTGMRDLTSAPEGHCEELRKLRDLICSAHDNDAARSIAYWSLVKQTLDETPSSNFRDLRGWLDSTELGANQIAARLWSDLNQTVDLSAIDLTKISRL